MLIYCVVSVPGDEDRVFHQEVVSGDDLADVVIEALGSTRNWGHLSVSVTVGEGVYKGATQSHIGPAPLRQDLRHEFERIEQALVVFAATRELLCIKGSQRHSNATSYLKDLLSMEEVLVVKSALENGGMYYHDALLAYRESSKKIPA